MKLETSNSKLVQTLFAITGLLVIAHLLNFLLGWPSWQVERLFHLELEENIPTWFSCVLWLIAAYSAYLCGSSETYEWKRRFWSAAAFVCLFLSIDEVAMIHEHAFSLAAKYLLPSGIERQIGQTFKATSWPVLAIPLLALVLPVLTWVSVKIFSGSGKAFWMVFSGTALVVAGGWGLELLTNFLNHSELEWLWQIEAVFEEGFEMLGAIVIISGLLVHQRVLAEKIEVRG